MIRIFKKLFGFPKQKQPATLYPFAVEAVLMIDENTEITKFVALIHAKSKKDAKWQINNRAFIKAGAVANKKQVEKFKNTKGHE